MLVLSAAEVRKALPMRETIEAMKSAYASLSAGRPTCRCGRVCRSRPTGAEPVHARLRQRAGRGSTGDQGGFTLPG